MGYHYDFAPKEVQPIGCTSFLTSCYPLVIFSELSIITIVGFEIPDRNRGAGMRTKDQGTLDKILKFVNKYYQENRVAPTISEVAAGVGVARSTTHRYIQELSDRDLLDYAKVKYNSPDALSTIVNNAFNNMYAKAE